MPNTYSFYHSTQTPFIISHTPFVILHYFSCHSRDFSCHSERLLESRSIFTFPCKWESSNKKETWIPDQVKDDSYCGFSVKLRMTKEDIKRRKEWIPNQVGDDNYF